MLLSIARRCIPAMGLLLSMAPGASAQEPPAAIWQGFYVGGHGGGVFGHGELTLPNGFSKTSSATRTIAGVLGGYNWQVGPWVLGGEFDWNRTVESGGDLFTFRGRAGYAIGNVLVYGTVGAGTQTAWVGFANTGERVEHTIVGVAAGGGVEAMLGYNLSLRVEALYFASGKDNYDFAARPPYHPALTITSEFEKTHVRGGITYHFN